MDGEEHENAIEAQDSASKQAESQENVEGVSTVPENRPEDTGVEQGADTTEECLENPPESSEKAPIESQEEIPTAQDDGLEGTSAALEQETPEHTEETPAAPEQEGASEGTPQQGTSAAPEQDVERSSSEQDVEGTSAAPEQDVERSSSEQDVKGTSAAPEQVEAAAPQQDFEESSSEKQGVEGASAAPIQDGKMTSVAPEQDIEGSSSDVEGTSAAPEQIEGTSAAPEQVEGTSAAPEQVEGTSAAPEQIEGTSAAPEQVGGTSAAPEQVEGTSAAPEQIEGTSAAPEQIEGTSAAPEQVGGTSAAPEQVEGTSAAPEQIEGTSAAPEQVGGTSTAEEHSEDPLTFTSDETSENTGDTTTGLVAKDSAHTQEQVDATPGQDKASELHTEEKQLTAPEEQSEEEQLTAPEEQSEEKQHTAPEEQSGDVVTDKEEVSSPPHTQGDSPPDPAPIAQSGSDRRATLTVPAAVIPPRGSIDHKTTPETSVPHKSPLPEPVMIEALPELQGTFRSSTPPPPPPVSVEDRVLEDHQEQQTISTFEAESMLPSAGSQVETASPNDAFKASQDEQEHIHHPLSLHWSFGYNSSLPVHDVSEGNRKMIFYVCAHTGVLFDCANNKQCLLQGHNNPISCSAVSNDRRWLATADSGQDCILIVWDSFTGIPVRTVFDIMGQGTAVIAMSPDSQFLATISANRLQVVSIWEWTNESDTPVCQVSLGEDYTYQTHLAFHQSDPYQLVSNSEDLVVFYNWKGNQMKFHSHPVLDKDFNKTIGRFYQSVFVPESTMGLTGTSEGHCVVWKNEGVDDEPYVKKGVKLMRIHDSPITVMTTTLEFVVTGDTEGRIKFFDNELKMVNWYEDTMKYGPISSLSFSYFPNISVLKTSFKEDPSVLKEYSYPPESTKSATPFLIPDFTISTTSASIVHFTTDHSLPEVLLSEHDASVNALATHPFLPYLVTSGYACKMKLWDYQIKVVLATRVFGEPNFIQCVCFDSKGEYISVGFTDGILQVLDAMTLSDVGHPFHYSRDAITKVAFSHDSKYMATADLDRCVTLYVAHPEDPTKPWRFLAKYRSHFKKIEDLMFGVKLDSDEPRLVSLGSDRFLVEYDLANSSEENLCLLSIDRIEQSAIPMAMTWYPPLTTESFLLVTNNQYKIKLYNSTTKMCRQTLLGPTFGSPIKEALVLPAPIIRGAENQEVRRYLAYCTNNKVGLILLPHDGNPHNSKCMTAHPGKLTDMKCSFDGKYIFTAGGEDCSVNMWKTNTEALEAISHLGGEDLQPFYAMLDGGRDGEFFTELEEFFYYAQIRSQGPDVTSKRKVSTTIEIEEIPHVMRAIGFYPSEQEIDDMLNEVKFSKFVETGLHVAQIDLGSFIRLYVNHRPVFGLSPLQIGHAFKVLGSKQEEDKFWCVDRNTLLGLIQEKGEHLTEGELVEYLMTLLGHSDNPEVDKSFTQDIITALEEIPEKISPPTFAEDIVGLSI